MITDEHPFEFAPQTDEYTQLLTDLHEEYCREQPSDVLQFCSNFFIRKLEEQRSAYRSSNNNTQVVFDSVKDLHPLSGQQEEHSGDIFWTVDTFMTQQVVEDEQDEDDEIDDEENDKFSTELLPSLPPTNYNRGRRTSVSAESIAPSSTSEFKKIIVHKSAGQSDRIKQSILNNFLFKNLDEEQYIDVVNAMSEKKVSKGIEVIEQGGVGDYFYVVESGTLDCFVGNTKVTDYDAGGSFGELALMYNAPRAATIITTSDCILWALDRVTFRTILMENTSRKRKMYESFLKEVSLLKSLESYEQHKIADALECVYYHHGENVISQGDIGDQFYIIESGEAIVYINDVKVNQLSRGSFFGELALLNDSPRAATVVAQNKLKCATLGKKAFTRLLGPVLDILKRNSENYHTIINQQ